MTKEIFPRWVKVGARSHNVSDFSHLPPPSRPEAICPLCMNPVIMKLGDERVHHYAHKHDIVCAATQPETALHLNTKFYIYEQLLSGSKLYLEQQCSNGCGKGRIISWVKDWERIEIEFTIGPFRPDILIVIRNGTNKAIEIKVTHPVEDAKGTFYKEQNIGWLEVEASESIYDGENAWKIAQPLPDAVCKPPLSKWTCYNCLAQLKKEKDAELRKERQQEYRQHNYSEAIYAKMVDYYYPSGKKYREIYYLNKVIHNDEPVGVLVQTKSKRMLFKQNGEINEALLELACLAVKDAIDEMSSRYRAIVEDRDWLPWVPGKKYAVGNTELYPFLYEWNDESRKWVKLEQQKLESDNTYTKEKRIPPQDTINITMQEGICIHCGQTTTDYWSFNGATRECKCRKCYREGKY